MDNASAVMGQDDEHEENVEGNGGHGEEIDGNQIPEMIVEERSPGRARWLRVADHVLGDRRLGQIDAELEQLAMNPGSAPQSSST